MCACAVYIIYIYIYSICGARGAARAYIHVYTCVCCARGLMDLARTVQESVVRGLTLTEREPHHTHAQYSRARPQATPCGYRNVYRNTSYKYKYDVQGSLVYLHSTVYHRLSMYTSSRTCTGTFMYVYYIDILLYRYTGICI